VVFRDGKVIRDERNPSPVKAAEALARLPAAEPNVPEGAKP